jgi:hypothetical protein
MSLLDLLGAVLNPDLSARERSQLRTLLRQQPGGGNDETPWQSGIIDRPGPAKTNEEILSERVADLELALKVLCDLLAERGLLEPNALPARIAAVQQQLAMDEAIKEDTQRSFAESMRHAAEARTVECASCHAVVRERESYLSGQGPLCVSCHHDREE